MAGFLMTNPADHRQRRNRWRVTLTVLMAVATAVAAGGCGRGTGKGGQASTATGPAVTVTTAASPTSRPATTPTTPATRAPATTSRPPGSRPTPTTRPAPAPSPTLPASLVGAEWTRLPTSRKVVALTFDAGAGAQGVDKILSTLAASGVRGTFFLTGAWVQDFPAQSRAIAARYPIGNHTDTHPNLRGLSDSAIRQQLAAAQARILAATGHDPRPLFRFPYGASDRRTIGAVNQLGYGAIRWTVDTLGWKGTSGGQSTQTVIARVLAGLQPGEIVLLHVGANPDDHSTLDADALATLITQVRLRGYQFATVDQYL